MPEWLNSSVSSSSVASAQEILWRLVAASFYGACVAALYRASHGRHEERRAAWTLTTTLMLLSVLIAMVSMVIGDSVARAFSLVGALSIVRFRTVVEDTRDTAFVIFAVIVGMAAGAGLLLAPLIGIPVVGVIAIVLGFASRPNGNAVSEKKNGGDKASGEQKLTVRMGLGRDPEASLAGVISRHAESHRQTAVAVSRKGASLDLTYRVRLKSPAAMTALVTELNQVEGVQEVELQ